MSDRQMTLGERRVRLTFNPSNDDLVQQINVRTAALIDLCFNHPPQPPNSGEAARLWSLAMTHYEEAAMWAVKAATA